MKKGNELILMIPIALSLNRQTTERIVANALEQYERTGCKIFIFHFPTLGHGGIGYPAREEWIRGANKFVEVKNKLQPYGIECAFYISSVLRQGHKEGFTRIVDHEGIENQYSNCPINEVYKETLSDDIALFAKIAKPSFIITEDDFCVHANAPKYGCLCDLHLRGFEKWSGKAYTREELVSIFDSDTKEGYALLKKWREFTKDSTVKLAERIREKLDIETPEIPMGTMQAGASDREFLTEDLARALAGKNHTPFTRLYGTFYNGGSPDNIPKVMFHSLYSRQHMGEDFIFIHESDTFPMYRYFSSASFMRAIMSTAYSYGFHGSIFNIVINMVDMADTSSNEEKAYGEMYAVEKPRFNALYEKVRGCELDGVEIPYDPFWNTVNTENLHRDPLWVRPLSNMGIPYTSKESQVACMDWVQAKHLEDGEIKKYLSKGLLLDGEAAKILCERGYSEYLGVKMGDNVDVGMYRFDLGACELIRDEFLFGVPGKEMFPAHWFANGGNGKLYKIDVIDEKCEIVSEEVNSKNEVVTVAMTRFENKLGGRIVIMGQTLENEHTHNYSQSLYNYRRQRLFQELIKWCGGEYIMSKDVARIHTIVNKPKDEAKCGHKGIVTIVNLCDDELNEIVLDLGGYWKSVNDFYVMDEKGNWGKANYTREDNVVKIRYKLGNLSALYIMLK